MLHKGGRRNFESPRRAGDQEVEQRRIAVLKRDSAIPEGKPAPFERVIQQVAADSDVGAFDRRQVLGVLREKELTAHKGVEREQRLDDADCADTGGGCGFVSPEGQDSILPAWWLGVGECRRDIVVTNQRRRIARRADSGRAACVSRAARVSKRWLRIVPFLRGSSNSTPPLAHARGSDPD